MSPKLKSFQNLITHQQDIPKHIPEVDLATEKNVNVIGTMFSGGKITSYSAFNSPQVSKLNFRNLFLHLQDIPNYIPRNDLDTV